MAAKEGTIKYMNMTEIIKRAKEIGIDPKKMKKTELIRSIQAAGDSKPCFGTTNGQCAYAECCFMPDCFKLTLTEYKQIEEANKQQIGELTGANEKLQREMAECQKEIAKRQQEQLELEQYSDRLEQRIEEQNNALVSANDNFQSQTAERHRLEQCFVQLQTKLDNINSIIGEQLELRAETTETPEPSASDSAAIGSEYN